MRKLATLALVLAVCLALPEPAVANRAVSGATTNIAVNSKTVASDRRIPVQIWSSSGSTSSVVIYVRTSDDAPWWTGSGMTVTNVSATGGIWFIPPGFSRVRFAVNMTDGDVHVEVAGWAATWTTE